MKVKCVFRSWYALRLFLAFILEQEGCYRQFVRNIGGVQAFDRYCRRHYELSRRGDSCLSAFVSGAFNWSATSEGESFWARIHHVVFNSLPLK